MSDILPCGCRPGFFLCPKAEALWAAANAAYKAWSAERTFKAWGEYELALERYHAHNELPIRRSHE